MEVGKRLNAFYTRVDQVPGGENTNKDEINYDAATAHKVSSDRSSRITRAKILQRIIQGEFEMESEAK